MNLQNTLAKPWSRWLSSLLLIYPVYFVVANISYYYLRIPLLYAPMQAAGLSTPSPWVILGSIFIAGLLAVLAILQVDIQQSIETITLNLHIRKDLFSVFTILLSGATLGLIFLYLVIENILT